MGIERTILTNFTGGEVSLYLSGRVDQSRYFNSCSLAENFIFLELGAAERRGGTRFIAEVKDSVDTGILIPFEYSDEQAYIIEAGDGYFRFYMDKGQILLGGIPYEIVTPYVAVDLDLLRWCQSNDVAYLVRDLYHPQVLTRTGHTAWTIGALDIRDGPYLDENPSQIQLTAAAVTGSGIVVTATPNAKAITGAAAAPGTGYVRLLFGAAHGFSTDDPIVVAAVGGTVEAIGEWGAIKVDATHIDIPVVFAHAWTAGGTVSANLFKAPRDIGRLLRFKGNADWGYGVITAVTNSFTATIDIKKDFDAVGPKPAWRLGLWSDGLGWPEVGTIHQERLTFGSKTQLRPQRIDGSQTGAFNQTNATFAPGTNDTDAIAYNIGADQASPVAWLLSSGILFAGTQSAPFAIKGDTSSASLKPTEGSAVAQGRRRCAKAVAVIIDNVIVFIDRLQRKLRGLEYDIETDSYGADDLSRNSEQATRSGLAQISLQADPFDVLWCRKLNGELSGFTYVPKEHVEAFHRHILGATIGGPAVVESMAIIPGGIGSDQVWLLVRRIINGQTKRYIEILEDPLPLDGDQADGFYVDCGLSYEGPPPPALVIDGLDHLIGETVQVVVDGAVQSDKVVNGAGEITLDDINPAAVTIKVHAGLRYVSRLSPLPLEAGASAGTSQGVVKIIRQLATRLLRTFGAKAGPDLNNLQDIASDRDPAVAMDHPMPLFTGMADVPFPGDYETDGKFMIVQDRPLPCTIAGIVVKVEADDE
jgi:hypothetical protein